ncbi:MULTISPECIES: restriction endonuclease subunit S [Mesorhizobium]|uniref:restriction endonuclease subunit S n=1 Tax=Mesorhizobium sp. TaxID=1871066 RepID=UPI000A07C798|nr:MULTISPECIES: restriction endonuclease subunit S [Mesorhizobium]RWM71189.1 MAG: restriction endonuclease subunit S [Mesorhizobium sp.]TIO24182.1 MAG: restriction endonuclease subunit S [Mesorhizobium sp.]TJV64198.1 MAG: restriction endonuclease subunit S [Mesorhizobium sp.]
MRPDPNAGTLPRHWTWKKLKHVARMAAGDAITSDDIRETGDYPVYGGNGLRGYTDNFNRKGNFVLIGRQGALCGNINYASGEFWASEHAIVADLQDNAEVRWLGELLSFINLNQYSQSAAQPGIAVDVIANLPIPVPPREAQQAIARFLGCETAEIDALIVAKQRLLDLLVEKRRVILAEAIMHGLNPSAPLRPSGIDWLGDIPAHWELERSRWLFRERDERSETGEEEMLTVSHLTGVTPRSEKDVNMFEAESTAGYKLCFAGDLAINTLWAWMGAMGTARVDGIVSPAYNVYTPGPRLIPDYVDALVRIPTFAQEVTRYSKGVWSSRLRLYPEGFFETYWPVPPIDEQHEIVHHISAETAKIDRLRAATEHSITLLKERRGALIAAVVTGQIDVPEAV